MEVARATAGRQFGSFFAKDRPFSLIPKLELLEFRIRTEKRFSGELRLRIGKTLKQTEKVSCFGKQAARLPKSDFKGAIR